MELEGVRLWGNCPSRERKSRSYKYFRGSFMRASGNNSTPAAPYTIDANAGIEDVHLKEGDLQRALDFYSGVLGLGGNATVRRRGAIDRGGRPRGERTGAPPQLAVESSG